MNGLLHQRYRCSKYIEEIRSRSGCGRLVLLTVVASLTMRMSRLGAEPSMVTFTKDIAPIFQAKCQACHQPNSIAPMSLITYQDARPWARAIKERVASRQMPPWHIDRGIGIERFKSDKSLTDEQMDGGEVFPEHAWNSVAPDRWNAGKASSGQTSEAE